MDPENMVSILTTQYCPMDVGIMARFQTLVYPAIID